jgi:hypothetical protein
MQQYNNTTIQHSISHNSSRYLLRLKSRHKHSPLNMLSLYIITVTVCVLFCSVLFLKGYGGDIAERDCPLPACLPVPRRRLQSLLSLFLLPGQRSCWTRLVDELWSRYSPLESSQPPSPACLTARCSPCPALFTACPLLLIAHIHIITIVIANTDCLL